MFRALSVAFFECVAEELDWTVSNFEEILAEPESAIDQNAQKLACVEIAPSLPEIDGETFDKSLVPSVLRYTQRPSVFWRKGLSLRTASQLQRVILLKRLRFTWCE